MISLRATPLSGWSRVAKRAMDIALGSLALVALAPLMLAIAVGSYLNG